MAILGYLITSHEISVKSPNIFQDLVATSNLKSQTGLQKYLQFSGKLVPSDYSAVCKLCYNIWWIRGKLNFILWPLLNIPQIPKGLLYRLASAVSDDKSDKTRNQPNVQTVGFRGSGIEGEGENFAPGEPVASAPS